MDSADAQRRRAAAHRDHLHARVHRHGDVLAQPRQPADRHLPVAPRGTADDDRGRPLPRSARTCPTCCGRRRAWRWSGEVPRLRLAEALRPRAAAARAEERQRARAPARHPPRSATLLRERGYHVALKGKWHLTKPVNRRRAGATPIRARLERDYGFADWEPPDAGGDAKARHVRRRPRRHDADRAGTRTTRARWSAGWRRRTSPSRSASSSRSSTPTTCSATRRPSRRAATRRGEFDDLDVPLPRDARRGPARQAHGPGDDEARARRRISARSRAASSSSATSTSTPTCTAQVDAKIGRLLAALGDPADPGSLRSRTVIVRTSDHGEMGLSHGGLRQKMFNAYEESMRVPFVVSSPALFREPRESDALVSLVDVVPTHARPRRASRATRRASTATTSARCCAARATRSATRCCSPTTTTRPARRSRRRRASPTGSAACATRRWKYAVYLDPSGEGRARVRALRPRAPTRTRR